MTEVLKCQIENEKLSNVLNFYMVINNLKYQLEPNSNQSVADHIYGTMILATAVNSEYEITPNLAKILQTILLSEINNYQGIETLNLFAKLLSKKQNLEKYNIKNHNFAKLISFCQKLDINLWRFFNEFLVSHQIYSTDYQILYKLAKENGFFLEWNTNENKNLEIFRFYYLNNNLKNKIRKGWDINHWNIKEKRIERISEHIVGTISLALAIGLEFNYPINLDKVVSMLCLHEVGEIIIGDITPFDGISLTKKREIEHQAIIEVFGNLTKRNTMINWIFDFDDQKNDESKFAYYCDKLEADIQSKVYQDMGCHHPLTEQQNNVVFKNIEIQKMVQSGATTAFDIWYEYDKSKYIDDHIFTKILKYVKNTKLK